MHHIYVRRIILESAYSLYDKVFFDNIRTILLMAVVVSCLYFSQSYTRTSYVQNSEDKTSIVTQQGTIANFLLVGLLLYAVFHSGTMGHIAGSQTKYYSLEMVEIMTFASLISAVDPVAVLAIFQEVGVNQDLYFILFGESLLNGI